MEQRFSDRIGITKPPTLQVGTMNDALRNSLWNVLLMTFDATGSRSDCWKEAAWSLAFGFFKEPTDSLPHYAYEFREWVKSRYYKLQWYEIYNLVQFLSPQVERLTKARIKRDQYEKFVNGILTQEVAGYRFINGIIEPISSEAEVKAVEDALAASNRVGLEAIHAHLTKSLDLLGQKPKPDHHNAIKEAISAVESAAKLISGEATGGLDAALTELSRRTPVHPAMKAAFLNLYGYTSSSEGIRHAMLEVSNVGFAETKFMVVACSAFVYFLILKAETAGLFKKTTA